MTRMPVPPSRLRAAVIALVALAAVAVAEEDQRTDPPDYTFTYELDTGVREVWDLLTTAEGMKTCGVALAEADFRPGGTLKTHYDPKGTIGDANTIVHHIDAVDPYRMFAARVTPPENAGFMKLLAGTHNVTYLERVAPDRTRVTNHSFGWGEGEEWGALRRHFDMGNAMVVKKLRAHFGDRDRKAETKATFLAFAKLTGDWLGEAELPDGRTMRIHTNIAKGPAGRSFVTRGTMRVGEKKWLHSAAQIWVAAGQASVQFHNLDESGATARGGIVYQDGAFVWDWTQTAFDGSVSRYRVRQVHDGDDAYTMHLLADDGAEGWKEEIAVAYRRVDGVPAEFE